MPLCNFRQRRIGLPPGASTVEVIGTVVNPSQIGISLIGRSAVRARLVIGPQGQIGTLCIGAPYIRGRVQAATPARRAVACRASRSPELLMPF